MLPKPATADLDLLDRNLRLATGAFIATSKTGEVLETRDVYIASTGVAAREFNVVFVKHPRDAVPALEHGARYFEAAKLPYRVHVRADLSDACREWCGRRGFSEVQSVPGMRLEPIPEAPPLPEGLEVKPVEDDVGLADFQRTAFEGFGLPPSAGPLFVTAEFLALPNVLLFVGCVEGEPVATAALVHTTGVAGIYWVATLERFRGRGYGEALTWQAVRAGRALGLPLASLQASELGRPVYERMGFRHDRDYTQLDSPD